MAPLLGLPPSAPFLVADRSALEWGAEALGQRVGLCSLISRERCPRQPRFLCPRGACGAGCGAGADSFGAGRGDTAGDLSCSCASSTSCPSAHDAHSVPAALLRDLILLPPMQLESAMGSGKVTSRVRPSGAGCSSACPHDAASSCGSVTSSTSTPCPLLS